MERRPDEMRDLLDDDFFEAQPDRPMDPETDVRAGRRLDRHNQKLEREYLIQGNTMKTPEVMDWVINQTYEGKSLLELTAVKGAPTMRTIMGWKREFPSFSDELKKAEEARAYILVERAQAAADGAYDKESAGVAKVRFQAATWNAAKLDPNRYTEKRIQETTVSTFEHVSTSALLDQLRAAIGANTEVFKLLNSRDLQALGMVIDVEPEVPESPP